MTPPPCPPRPRRGTLGGGGSQPTFPPPSDPPPPPLLIHPWGQGESPASPRLLHLLVPLLHPCPLPRRLGQFKKSDLKLDPEELEFSRRQKEKGQKVRANMRLLIEGRAFIIMMSIITLISVIGLTLYWYGVPHGLSVAGDWIYWICSVFFFLEFLLKFFVYREVWGRWRRGPGRAPI